MERTRWGQGSGEGDPGDYGGTRMATKVSWTLRPQSAKPEREWPLDVAKVYMGIRKKLKPPAP